MLRRIVMLAGALLAFAPALAAAQPAAPAAPEKTVYRGATLIDGTGAPPRRDMAVVTEGERIAAVLPSAALTPEHLAGAAVRDLGGRTLIPGLIDAHEHIATPPNRARAEALLRRDLYGGITAVRSMADDLRPLAEYARASRAGEIPAPDIHFAALVAGAGFFDDPRVRAASGEYRPGDAPWMQAIDDATDLPLAIARARGTGATGLKIYADLEPHLVRALAAEARRQGLLVWVHGIVFPTRPADVIAADPHILSHTCYLAYQIMPEPPRAYRERSRVDHETLMGADHPAITALLRDMKARGIILDATLRVYDVIDRRQSQPNPPPSYCSLDLAARLTDQARREGVEIAAGTDAATPREDPWPALHHELELLVGRAGMSPLEAIRAATLNGARTIGREADMGTVEPGKLANLVVLDRDPIADIANIRSVALTVKRGRAFERTDYRPIGRDEMPD